MTTPAAKSYPGDGVLPSGSPDLMFNQYPGLVFSTDGFSVSRSLNVTNKTYGHGNHGGARSSVGVLSGSCSVDVDTKSELKLITDGLTFVHEVNGIAYGFFTTSFSPPQEKDGEIKVGINFQACENPLILGAAGDVELTVGQAMTPISLSVNARHNVSPSDIVLETEDIEHFRPLEDGPSNGDCAISLPAGLSMSNGTISGTPTQSGETPIRIRATDDKGRKGWLDLLFIASA